MASATRGPVPKRSSERRRRNKQSKPDTVAVIGKVKPPAVSAHWHPIAKAWFKSLAESGQSTFFEPSDWQGARFVAESMTQNLKAKRFSAQLFAAVWAAMGDLLTTEADRRRARMEIDRELDGTKKPAGVTALDEYRQALRSS